MKRRVVDGLATWSLGGLCAALAACAGSGTPSVSDELAEALETAYTGAGGNAAVGNAGSAGSGDPGGAAGAGMASGAGGGNGGGAAGATMNGAAGASMAGGAGASGASDEGGAGTGGTGAPTCNGFAVLAANCGSSGCHGEGSNLGTFAASEADARDYIGSPGTVSCVGQGQIIDTDDPAASLMVLKLSDDPPCGQPMPGNGQLLPQADIDCIEDWISGL